ncbi:unnamed protein product [Amoebophrya sp. A120]|nr:unnamed protein product [Amoebophrya sp. A120]|eukprot:GSA120T00016129001.1
MPIDALFVSHGGGPLPLLGDPNHAELVATLEKLGEKLREEQTARTANPNDPPPIKPIDVVVLISAHHEEAVCTVQAEQGDSGRGSVVEKTTLPGAIDSDKNHHPPPLLYDYYGFPPEAYNVSFPGSFRGASIAEAEEIRAILEQEEATGDHPNFKVVVAPPSRGFDHGVFVPLKVMKFSEAISRFSKNGGEQKQNEQKQHEDHVLIVQVSLLKDLSLESHASLGRRLGRLQNVFLEKKQKRVLILGSGMSFHNMQAFFSSSREKLKWKETSEKMQEELVKAVREHMRLTTEAELDPARSTEKWSQHEACQEENWKSLFRQPLVKESHPRLEHLLPLVVTCFAAGCRGKSGKQVSIEEFSGGLMGGLVFGHWVFSSSCAA